MGSLEVSIIWRRLVFRKLIAYSVALPIACLIILFSCSDNSSRKESKKHLPNDGSVVGISVLGSLGQPVLKTLLDRLVKEKSISWVKNEHNEKVKLNGHREYSSDYIGLIEQNNIKVVLIYRDIRDNLHFLVNRSIYGWKNFDKPNIHPKASKYDDLIKLHKGLRGDLGFVEFYVDTIGAKKVLDEIFQTTVWMTHPQVLAVKWEDLVNFTGNNRKGQLMTISNIANFVGVDIDDTYKEKLANECSDIINQMNKQLGSPEEKAKFMMTWKDFFTNEDKVLFKKYWGDQLIKLGYEKDYNW